MSKTYEGIWLISNEVIGETCSSEYENHSHMEFGVKTTSDLDNLPIGTDNYKGYGYPAPWSLAKDAETGDIYFLDLDSDSWKKVGV